jgi:hypothetical protein
MLFLYDHSEQRGRRMMAVSFKGAHFPKAVILMEVRWYVAYPLSTRHFFTVIYSDVLPYLGHYQIKIPRRRAYGSHRHGRDIAKDYL